MLVMSFTLLLTIWLNIWKSMESQISSQNFSKSTWIHIYYLFERLQNRTIPSATTKVSCQKNDSNYTCTPWVCIISSRSCNGKIELWLYDSVVASFQLYIWANLRAPSPCLLAMVPGYSGILCTWSSPFPEYKSRTGLRGSPSWFATWKHILHTFYQGSYFSYYNFFFILIETQINVNEVRTSYLHNWTLIVKNVTMK